MALRPAAIQECDQLLVLEGGLPRAIGPRDEVLRSMVKEVHAKAHAPKTPTKIIRDKTRKATHYERDGQQYPIKYGPDGRIEEA